MHEDMSKPSLVSSNAQINGRENRPLVTDEPVEVQDFTKTTDNFRGIYGIYLNLIKKM